MIDDGESEPSAIAQAIKVDGPRNLDDAGLMIARRYTAIGLAWRCEDMVTAHIAAGQSVEVLGCCPGLLYHPSCRDVPTALSSPAACVTAPSQC